MAARALMNRLYYFTIEDETMLSEAFSQMGEDVFAVTYKVNGTEDVFVTTSETRRALDQQDVSYNLLAEEESNRVSIYHSPLSKEELADYEDAIKALALSYRAIGLACVGVNGESDLGFDLSDGAKRYTYFTAPAGHTFIWRIFHDRADAEQFLREKTLGDKKALDWVESLPIESADELKTFH